jgi:hypothetical protein
MYMVEYRGGRPTDAYHLVADKEVGCLKVYLVNNGQLIHKKRKWEAADALGGVYTQGRFQRGVDAAMRRGLVSLKPVTSTACFAFHTYADRPPKSK